MAFKMFKRVYVCYIEYRKLKYINSVYIYYIEYFQLKYLIVVVRFKLTVNISKTIISKLLSIQNKYYPNDSVKTSNIRHVSYTRDIKDICVY